MTVLLNVLYLAAGIIGLYYGAELLVKYSGKLAVSFGVKPLVVGLTLIAFGTSAPELVVGIISQLKNASTLALGNVVGSNIANIGLILGAAALIRPLEIDFKASIKFEIPVMIAATLLVIWGGITSYLTTNPLLIGIVFLCGFVFFLIFLFKFFAKLPDDQLAEDLSHISSKKKGIYFILTIIGLGVLVLGSDLFVRSAVFFAHKLGVSEFVIGVTIVALGTSLPELAASIASSVKQQSDIAYGNVIGSNIINIFLVLGVTLVLGEIVVTDVNNVDYIALFVISIIFIPEILIKKRIGRLSGTIMVILYFAFIFSKTGVF